MASRNGTPGGMSPQNSVQAQHPLMKSLVANVNNGGYSAPMAPNNQPQQLPQANLLSPQNMGRAGKGSSQGQPQNFSRVSPAMKF